MWTKIVTALIGLWLMISPSVLKMNELTSNNNYIVGPLVITFSVISFWDINRKVIRANIPLGAWLLIALFVLEFTKSIAFFSNGACGAFIILLSSIKRKAKGKYGGGWKSLFQHNPPHLQEAEKMSS